MAFIIPPTLASAANAEAAAQGAAPAGRGSRFCQAATSRANCKSGDGRRRIEHTSLRARTWKFSGFEVPASSTLPGLTNQTGLSLSMRAARTRSNVPFSRSRETLPRTRDRSKELNRMKIVALAFAAYRSGIAAVSVDSAEPALRKVSFIGGDDLQVFPNAMDGKDSIRLSEGFQPNGVAFGPGDDELTLTSWSGVRILDLRDGNVTPSLHRLFAISSCAWSLDQATLLRVSSRHRSTVESKSQRVRAARAGRACGLPRFNRNCTVQFGWPTIADFIWRNMECVRQHAPHRCQSVLSAAGTPHPKIRSKACASMAGRYCQRSERTRHRRRWLFAYTGNCAGEVSGKQSW